MFGDFVANRLACAPVVAVETDVNWVVDRGVFEHFGVGMIVEILDGRGTHQLSVEQRQIIRQTHREAAHSAWKIRLVAKTLVHQFVFGLLSGVGRVQIEVDGVVLVQQIIHIQFSGQIVGSVV